MATPAAVNGGAFEAALVPFPEALSYYGGQVTQRPVPGGYYDTTGALPSPPNVTSISSTNGQIDLAFSGPIGTVPVPTSDPQPAVQITGATKPSDATLRLGTGPAYPTPLPPDSPAGGAATANLTPPTPVVQGGRTPTTPTGRASRM